MVLTDEPIRRILLWCTNHEPEGWSWDGRLEIAGVHDGVPTWITGIKHMPTGNVISVQGTTPNEALREFDSLLRRITKD